MNNKIMLRSPTSMDARAMRILAQDSKVLSVNSTYYYALLARHFQSTCLVAEVGADICGYVIGYFPPEQPHTLFVWQVGVANKWQGKKIGKKLLISLVQATRPDFLEATIAAQNKPSINLFKSVAHNFGTNHSYSLEPFFGEAELGKGEEPENLMRIGPFKF